MLFTQPIPPEDALAFADKILVGSPLNSAEWQDVSVELRLRAFFSSEVESVQFLQAGRDSIKDFLANNRDEGGALKTGGRAQFVDQMQKFLSAHGVERSTGGLTDIAGQTRLSLIFDTQVRQANDYAYWKSGMTPAVLNQFPAQRFIRVKAVKEPRQTHSIYEGQVFLKTDPIWELVINKDFGVPWGPWGWGCGHDVEDEDRQAAEKLGLIQRGQKIAPVKKWNFNSDLRASIKNLDPDLVAKLKQVFGDKIIIEGDTMRWAPEMAARVPVARIPVPVPAPAVQRTAPVSAAVDIRTTKAAAKTVREVLAMIDQVHDDGELEPLILDHHISRGAQGVFYRDLNRIGIRRTGVKDREMTVVHEIGHWLDYQALPGSRYSSQSSPELEEWRQAMQASQAVKNLETLPAYRSNPDYREYSLRVREIWARSYAQYIALRSGNAKLLQQIDAIRNGTSDGFWVDWHWSDEDFQPIASAIDKLFSKLGWL